MQHPSPPAARWPVSVFDKLADPALAGSAVNYLGSVLADNVPTAVEAAVSTPPAS